MEINKLTTWGSYQRELDVRALQRYNALIARCCQIGEAIIFLLLFGILFFIFWLMTQTNFENIIFYDGTNHVCLYMGKGSNAGEIIYVE